MIRNRITLDELVGLDIGVIAAQPAEELALLADEAREALERAKAVKDRLDAAIDRRYGVRKETV